MRKTRSLTLVVACVLFAGCSPYLYKSEITGFSDGLNQLDSAYVGGLKSVVSDLQDQRRLDWTTARVPFAVDPACMTIPDGQPVNQAPCRLRQSGVAEPAAEAVWNSRSFESVPALQVLRLYAEGLAAVTNAEDQKTFEAAKVQLKSSMDALVTASKKTPPAALGPVADSVAYVALTVLDHRRYIALKKAVTEAREPVRTLGLSLGEGLDTLRRARINALNLSADVLAGAAETPQSQESYTRLLDAATVKINQVQELRMADPTKAAKAMVKAHDDLADALNDDSRQIKNVLAAVKAFQAQAQAVRKSLED